MGIKTDVQFFWFSVCFSLKNLPTTWGLRLYCQCLYIWFVYSEKPPHHMGIKTRICDFESELDTTL